MKFRFLKESHKSYDISKEDIRRALVANGVQFNESLMDEIREAEESLIKIHGPNIVKALDDYYELYPQANVFFSEGDYQEFLSWALDSGYDID